MFEQNSQEMLALTTNKDKVIMDKEITSTSTKVMNINRTQIMHVALEMILELAAIKKVAFLTSASPGTLTDLSEIIGLDREIEKKEKSSKPSLKIGTSTLQITGQVILG